MFALNAQRRQGQGDFTEEVAWRMGDSYRKKGEEGRIACLSPFFLSASNRGRSRPAVALSLGARSRPSLPPAGITWVTCLRPHPAEMRNFPASTLFPFSLPFPSEARKRREMEEGRGPGLAGDGQEVAANGFPAKPGLTAAQKDK